MQYARSHPVAHPPLPTPPVTFRSRPMLEARPVPVLLVLILGEVTLRLLPAKHSRQIRRWAGGP